ncbi:MAG: hypothetical protein ACYS26_08365 [Planctomycetota bacterium]|jgi:hypothetical protein
MGAGFRERLYSMDLLSQEAFLREELRKDYLAAEQRGAQTHHGDPTLWKLYALVALRIRCVFDHPDTEECLQKASLGLHHVIEGGQLPEGSYSMEPIFELQAEIFTLLGANDDLIRDALRLSNRPESRAYLALLAAQGTAALREAVTLQTLQSIHRFSTGPFAGESWS